MVITTFPDGEDAQADTVLDDALTIPSAAVTSFISDTPHTHRHSIILEEKARHSALGSLWIERLKSRDEPNGFNAEEHCSSERSPKSLLVIKETGICERATSICETAHLIRKFDQGAQNSSLSLRINGYVKQLNPTQSATREEKSQTMSIMNSSFTSKQCKLSQTSDQALEVHSSALQRSQSQRRLLTSTSGKPPLPPMHRKSGFLPWHPVHKSQGFSSSRAGKITSPAINEKHADAPRNIALDNKESFLTLGKSGLRPLRKEKQHTQDFKEDVLTRDGKFLLPEAKCTPDGLFSARTASSQDLRVNSSKINVFVTPPVGIGGDGCPIRHQDCRNMVTTIEEMESLKNLSGLEIDNVAVLKGQSAATGEGLFCDFHSDRSALNPIGDSSGSFLKSNKGLRRSFTASVTTCSSWESLDESAGPSRRKVQQVHRAVQNDLQSQRMPSLISKVTNDKSKSCGVLDSRRDLCVKIMPITMCEDRLSEKEQYSESQPYRKFKVESDDKSSQAHEGIQSHPAHLSSLIWHGQPGGFFHYHTQLNKRNSNYIENIRDFECRRNDAFTEEQHVHSNPSCKGDYKAAEHNALMLLSKREDGLFGRNPAILTAKESTNGCESSVSRSQAWLQRWHPSKTVIRHLQEHELLKIDRVQQVHVSSEGDSDRPFELGRESRKRLIEKDNSFQKTMTEKELKSFRFFPGNSPPTAAAMAIVGTAAQNFCKMQSQSQGKKASFSFWSGYEVRAPPMSSSSTEIAEKI